MLSVWSRHPQQTPMSRTFETQTLNAAAAAAARGPDGGAAVGAEAAGAPAAAVEAGPPPRAASRTCSRPLFSIADSSTCSTYHAVAEEDTAARLALCVEPAAAARMSQLTLQSHHGGPLVGCREGCTVPRESIYEHEKQCAVSTLQTAHISLPATRDRRLHHNGPHALVGTSQR